MIFGIVGLGLIGGSLPRNAKFHSDHTVYGADGLVIKARSDPPHAPLPADKKE